MGLTKNHQHDSQDDVLVANLCVFDWKLMWDHNSLEFFVGMLG